MSAISTFSGHSLAAQSGGYQPQRKDNFAVVISGVPEIDKLVLAITGVKIPPLQVGQGKVKHFNETAFFAAARTPTSNAKIVFNDYIDRDIFAVLSKWYKSVYCPSTGAIGWASDYKKSGEVYLLPPGMPSSSCPGVVSASAFRNRKWRLTGVWPMNLDYDELSMDDDGTSPAKITLELSVDRAIPEHMA